MKEKKRVILSAGGTGGHLFPARAVADELTDQCELLFVAGGLNSSPYFDRSYPYKEIDTATFRFSKPLQVMRGGLKVARGVGQSRRILKEFAPDLIVGFGSFYTLPMLVAAKLEKIPFLLHEQNAHPGKVNCLFSRFAQTTAITFPSSRKYLKGESIEVAFPVRKSMGGSAWDYFGFEKRPTLLVFGGSQGSRAINSQMVNSINAFKDYQIIHFVGKHGDAKGMKKVYDKAGIVSCVKTFERRFDLALQIADFAICRAGASTIAELIKNTLPAILIPFPYASDDHQVENAAHFTNVVRGGVMLLENQINKLPKLLPLDLKNYRTNIAAYRDCQQLKNFTQLILET